MAAAPARSGRRSSASGRPAHNPDESAVRAPASTATQRAPLFRALSVRRWTELLDRVRGQREVAHGHAKPTLSVIVCDESHFLSWAHGSGEMGERGVGGPAERAMRALAWG